MSSHALLPPHPLEFDDPLTLPAEPAAPARAPVPILAMVVPLVGAVMLWLVTGSVLSLWLALLGPLIAGATFLDGRRASRKERRRATAATAVALDRIADDIDARHQRERARRHAQHPDVAGFLANADEIWRAVAARGDGLVVGTGDVPIGLQISGGGSDEQSTALRRRARTLTDAPVVVPASGGIAVVATPVMGAAVTRALVLQTCLAHPPGELRIVGPLAEDDRWIERLPHRRAATGTGLAIVAEGAPVPPDAELAIVRIDPSARVPPGCAAVLTVTSPRHARLDAGGGARELTVEGVSHAQAADVAARLAALAAELPAADASAPAPVALDSLMPEVALAGLGAVIGLEDGGEGVVDLVADGPHAVVAGMTGSGKSELLVTWVLAICATRSPREVSFLLADFKGGTAFDALAELPHVTGVITDLDGAGARRAIESLRAEVRWREAELARCGARDILDPRVELPRLVVVVDEFAALLGDHPELHAVFTDIAARGRALGMHLVLGTQRVAGVVRDALLANCPLRVSLRVADTADSRAVLGTDDAARLTGGASGRGVALVRRAGDATPRRLRVALSSSADIARIISCADGHRPRRPWLPDLPRRVELADLPHDGERPDELVLGLADEPERQRQVPVGIPRGDRGLLVVGAAGTGKSTALRTLATQAAAVVVPPDPEAAWDAVTDLVNAPPSRGSVVVIDDLDALAARFPHEYAAEVTERLERFVRGAGDHGLLVIAAAQRLAGSATRIGELLPRRLILGTATRAEHIALGGEGAHHAVDQPPGRARLEGRALQVAVTAYVPPPPRDEQRPWFPVDAVTGFVARRSAAARAALAEWEGRGIRVVPVAEATIGEDPRAMVLTGDAEDWQRHWQVLTRVRSDHTLVIDASMAADFRALSADRELPPYCSPGRGRAWLCRDANPAERITLPGAGVMNPTGSRSVPQAGMEHG